LASCIDSTNPLSNPKEAKVDKELVGVWQNMSENGDVGYLHVGRVGGAKLPDGILRLITAGHNRNGTLGSPGELLAFTSVLGKNRFLNILLIDNKDEDDADAKDGDDGNGLRKLEKSGWKPSLIKGYLILKYEVQGDSVVFWTADQKVKRRWIEEKKIAGTVDKNVAYFTGTTEKLASLMSDPKNADLFSETSAMKYKRVK
jgi:hypothetical protein